MPYTEPVSADVKARYPAFAAVDDATIAYWLTDAHRYVDTSWFEADYAPALIDVACHYMSRARTTGIAGSDVAGFAAAGVSEFRSGGQGGFQAKFSDDAIKANVAGGYESTEYGMNYLAALARNKGGGVTAPGVVPGGGYPGFRDGIWPC